MKSFYFKDFKDFESCIYQSLKQIPIQSFMFAIADKNKLNVDELLKTLNQIEKPFFGGIFSEIIFENKKYEEGILNIPLNYKVDYHIVFLDNESKISNQIENISNQIDENFNTVWVYLNCFSSNKTTPTETLYQNLGYNFTYIGGEAGSLSFNKMPCVFNNSGIYENATILAFTNSKLAIGVAHGWQPISKKLKATETNGNNIISIDWKPVVEVYSDIVEEHSKTTFQKDGFFDLANSYPLGMVKIDGDIIVRDPIMIQNNQFVIVDKINEGEFIQILNGNFQSLLKVAQTTKKIETKANNYQNLFCIDYISRVLYMNNDFQKEIDIIKGDNTLKGILYIGEIANNGSSYLDIFNKTTIVA
jgi:hypothetical protein